MTRIVLAILGAVVLLSTYSCFSGRRSSPLASGPRPKIAAPARQLATGTQGRLADHTYVVDAQAVVEIARVAGRHDRREYQLHDEAAAAAVLVNGLSGGSKEWHLFRPVPVPNELTPYDAAAKRKGTAVNLPDRPLRITDLFQSKVISAEGGAGREAVPGKVHYGFVAHDAGDWLIARWTESEIQFLRGTAVPEADVIAALARPPDKVR